MLAEEYPITQIGAVLEVARSSYYHRRVQTNEQDLRLGPLQPWLASGHAMVSAHHQVIATARWLVNHKRGKRLMRELGLKAHRKPKRRVTITNSSHPFARYPNWVEHLEIVRLDQLWGCGITSIRFREEFVYLAVLMDVFTQCMRGWRLGRSLDMQPLPLPHSCKRQECRSAWQRSVLPSKMAMPSA